MNIQRMHSEIKLRYNKFNTNQKPDLPTAFIDDFINDAQDDFLHICYSGNNYKRYKLGFEVTQQRIDMLSSMVIAEEDSAFVSLIKPGIYKFNLTSLDHPYRHHVAVHVTTSCGRIECIPVRHQDLDSDLRNENTKPSAVWRRCLFVQASDGNGTFTKDSALYFYTGGEFTISSVTISYIKEPPKVFYGGYNTLEFILGDTQKPGIGDPPQNCEFPEISHSSIVEIAVQSIARTLEDTQGIQITEDKINRII